MYINNVTLAKTQPMIVHCDKFSIEIWYIWSYTPFYSIERAFKKLCLLKLTTQIKQTVNPHLI